MLRKFKGKYWSKFEPSKRQQILQKLENKMAKHAHRPALPISIVTNPDWYCFGMFEVKNNKSLLHLNISLITRPDLRFQALATVLHEGRHATQHFISTNNPAWFQFRARRWRRNMNNYVSSTQDTKLYKMQEVERDAQLFVLKKLTKWKHKFEGESDFDSTYFYLKKSFEKNEQDAKEKYGPFYKHKINREIKKLNRQ